MLIPLKRPGWTGETLRFRTEPRKKRSFNTVLDAAELLPSSGETVVHAFDHEGDLVIELALALANGGIKERVAHAPAKGESGLRLRRLERRIFDAKGALSREETADFDATTHSLPACTYVDVSTPFLLGSGPFEPKPRSLYTWICDRFVAKVYYETRGQTHVEARGRSESALEVIMYPDLNDWVSLPSIITKLSKPFVPKYHMFYEPKPPHRLLRFEGPLGPPGAPEVVMTLE